MKSSSKGLLLMVVSLCLVFGCLTGVRAAANPYPTSQNVDGDNYTEIPCTWFAWQQAYEKTGIALPAWGNAGSWYSNAAKAGYSVGSTPKANSIAVWTGDYYGHVAYVTSVSSSNTFTVNEGGRTDLDHTSSKGVAYGYTLTNAVGQPRPWDTGKTLVGFIYLNANPKPNPSRPDISNVTPKFVINQSTGQLTVNWTSVKNAERYSVVIKNSSLNEVNTQNNLIAQTATSKLPYKGVYSIVINAYGQGGSTTSKPAYVFYYGEKENIGNNRIVRIKSYGDRYVYSNTENGTLWMQSLGDKYNERYMYRLLRQNDGTYMIQSMYDPTKYMDILNNSNSNSTSVVLKKKSEASNPYFNIYSSSFGGYIIDKNNSSKVFDSTSNNGNLYIWQCSSTNNQYQYFEFEDVDVSPQSIAMYESSLTLEKGDSYKCNYDIYPSYASRNVTWRTGNSKVATVDQNGKVTAKGVGNTWLYARTKNGIETKCLVKVINPARAISLNMSTRTMSVGTKYQFKANVTPNNTSSTISWRTGNSKVATVDKNGKVTAKSVGNTWLYARTSNGLETKALIKVIPAANSVKITNTVKTLKKGRTHVFKAIVNPTKASQNVTWRTGNSKVATVDKNGRVTARGIGNTWLYARTINGKEAKTLINVVQQPTTIKLDADKKYVSVGKTTKFTATVKSSTGNRAVTWRTGNSKVATVDKSGKVTGKAAGSTWLYAKTADGKEAKALVQVLPLPVSVKITSDNKMVITGKTAQYKATVSPSNANQTVTWRVGNTKIATVDKYGKVTAKSIGNTWLYAKTINGKEAKYLVKVSPIPNPQSILIDVKGYDFVDLQDGKQTCVWHYLDDDYDIGLGNKAQFGATVFPYGASQVVSLRTGNSKIASIDKNGVLTANGLGNTWLYAKANNGIESRILIKVKKNDSFTEGKSKRLNVGKTYQMNRNDHPVWRIGNPKVATVDKNGVIKGISLGNTWLYATNYYGEESKILIKIDNKFTKKMTPAETNKIKDGDIITQYPDLKTLIDKDLYYKLDEETGEIRLFPLDLVYYSWNDTFGIDIPFVWTGEVGGVKIVTDQELIKILEAMPGFIEAKESNPFNGRIDYHGNGVWKW